MNKLIIDEYDINLNDFEGILEIQKENTQIHLKGTNKITDINLNDYKNVTMILEDDCSLSILTKWMEKIEDKKIIINCKNNTELDSRFNIECSEKVTLNFDVNLQGNQNNCHILFHVVTEGDGTCKIKTTGCIEKATKENVFLEEIKGLSFDKPSITFLPELIVDSDDVIANHNAWVKCVGEEELFYLKSKGIQKEDAIILMKKGFLNQR